VAAADPPTRCPRHTLSIAVKAPTQRKKVSAPRKDEHALRTLIATVAFAAVVGIALIVLVMLTRSGADPAVLPPGPSLVGIPQKGVVLGQPEAGVTLIEYADLQCPYCREYTVDVFPTIVDDYLRTGKIKTEFRGVAFLGPDSEKGLRLVLAAGLQNKAFELQDELFRHQGAENSGWVTDELVRELAAGIPGLDVDRMFADAPTAAVTAEMDRIAAQASESELSGTPAFFIQIGNAAPYPLATQRTPEAFRAALDDALAG
jgi:protein-disulfide isomerase